MSTSWPCRSGRTAGSWSSSAFSARTAGRPRACFGRRAPDGADPIVGATLRVAADAPQGTPPRVAHHHLPRLGRGAIGPGAGILPSDEDRLGRGPPQPDPPARLPPRHALQHTRPDWALPLRFPPHRLHRPSVLRPALFVMGTYLLVESIIKLVTAEYPTINSVELFGQTIWLGWLMLPALAWSGLPAVFLGRAKIPLAEELHNKVLYADAKMNKANWLTAGAAMVGVVGIGFGLWWADAVAAALISLDITKDGVSNLRRAVVDLMDQAPTTVDHDDADPLRGKLAAMLQDLDWVEDVDLRLREEGQVYFGEAIVVSSDETNIPEKVENAIKRARDLDWRIYDLTLTPVRELPGTDERTAKGERAG